MSEYWVICVQEQGGGHHQPNVRVVDASKLPQKMREAYLACDGKAEEDIENMFYGKDNITDEESDEFWETLGKACIQQTENIMVSKILTYAACW